MIKSLLVAAITAAMFSATAIAEEMTSSQEYGYRTYFRYHPPKEQEIKNNLYPFDGGIIPYGHDIKICDAARIKSAYNNKNEIKFISHGQDGWLFRTSDYRTDFTASPETINLMSRLSRALSSQGKTLVVAVLPPRAMVSAKHIDQSDAPKGYTPEKAMAGYQSFLSQLEEAGIKTVDLSRINTDISYYPKGDFHWTPEGADDAARKIASTLQSIPSFKGIKKQDFESEIIGMGPANRGSLEEFIQNVCKMNIQLTTENLWATTPKSDIRFSDAERLLKDFGFPEITVVGSKNTYLDDRYNFIGALKRYARADVYNAALSEDSFGASSYRYYASDEYRKYPPKIIIWEFLPQYNYNNPPSQNAMRQMIPAVYGACSDKNAIAKQNTKITREQTEIFSNINGHPLKNTYVYMEVSEPKQRSLKLEVLYKNGDADQVDLSRSTRARNNGKYYVEVGNEVHDHALLMHLITDPPQGNVKARLCQYPVHIAEK